MDSGKRTISTPVFVRWQRMQHGLVPLLAVALGCALAWRLWREAPRLTVLGQVDLQSVDVMAPASGEELVATIDGKPAPKMLEFVSAGQIIGRVKTKDGVLVDVAAPVGGQLTVIHHQPGEFVNKGQTLFTLSGGQALSITTYVRSDQRTRPEPGMTVEVRSRSESSRLFKAVVERVGPQYEPVPAAQLRDRKTEEWGLPVVIAAPPEAGLKPGEIVYVGWLPTSEPSRQ